MIDRTTESLIPTASDRPSSLPGAAEKRKLPGPKALYAVVIFLIVCAVVLANKGLAVAAVVDGKPIFTYQLMQRLMSDFGKQTLEQMISEQIINEESRKAGVVVTQADIDAKQKEILASLGTNVSLDDLLQYQGITKDEFTTQLRMQIAVQKLLGKDIEVTDADIDAYIASHSATLTATEPAALRSEAKQAIIDQEVSQKVQPWFTALKAKSKILRFINE